MSPLALRGYVCVSVYVCGVYNMEYEMRTMAKPTSAFLSAGPSLVPSPVTATTSRVSNAFDSIMPFTSVYLSVGDERASTRSFGHTLSSRCCWTCTSNVTSHHVIQTKPNNNLHFPSVICYKNIAPLIEQGGNSKYYLQKNNPKKHDTKELFSYVLLF
jgi:hypothetical protein